MRADAAAGSARVQLLRGGGSGCGAALQGLWRGARRLVQRRLCGAASASWDAGLDAALFESSQEVWALRLPERECGRAMDALRDHVLRLPRIRSIQPDPNGSGFRRLLLAPPDADSADADAVSAPQRPAPGRRRSPRRGVCQAAPPPAAAESFAAEHGGSLVRHRITTGYAQLSYAQVRGGRRARGGRGGGAERGGRGGRRCGGCSRGRLRSPRRSKPSGAAGPPRDTNGPDSGRGAEGAGAAQAHRAPEPARGARAVQGDDRARAARQEPAHPHRRQQGVCARATPMAPLRRVAKHPVRSVKRFGACPRWETSSRSSAFSKWRRAPCPAPRSRVLRRAQRARAAGASAGRRAAGADRFWRVRRPWRRRSASAACASPSTTPRRSPRARPRAQSK